MKKNKLEIELVGGLGNQLFCYFAGVYISKQTNSEILFIHNLLPEKHSQFDSRITDFNLPLKTKTKTNVSNNIIVRFCVRIIDSVTYRVPIFRVLRDKKIYYEKRIGLDKEINAICLKLDKNKRGVILKGHFQDISYYNELNSLQPQEILRPKRPSTKYLGAMKSKELSKLTVLHIRRGDFNQFAGEIGLLNEDYYKAAIEKLISYDPNLNIVTISDDITEAKKIFPKQILSINKLNDGSLFPEKPAELLLTMSYAKNLILSNSTFSLWSGILARHSKFIIYPLPFNLNTPLNVQGFPKTWIPMPAKFENNLN